MKLWSLTISPKIAVVITVMATICIPSVAHAESQAAESLNYGSGVVNTSSPETSPPFQLGEDSTNLRVKPRYIVRTNSAEAVSKVLNKYEHYGIRAINTFSLGFHGFLAELTSSQRNLIATDPDVLDISKDKKARAFGVQDTDYSSWHLDRLDYQRNNSLYNFNATGDGVDIYVVDSGVRSDHAEFTGRITRGYNAITSSTSASSYEDCNGHGTHVAGLAAGTIYGVAKQASIIPVKVLDCNGSGTVSNIISGLTWIKANKVAGRPSIVNMSLGVDADATLDAAVTALINDGFTVVAAAGNEFANPCTGVSAVSPARMSTVITVGGLDRFYDSNIDGYSDQDALWSSSNYGSCVDLYAPAASIYSAWNTGFKSREYLSGTSMSAPLTSGVSALYLQANPNKTPAEVHAKLIEVSIKDVIDISDYGTLSGFNNRSLAISTPPASIEPGDTKALASPIRELSFSSENGIRQFTLNMSNATYSGSDPAFGNTNPTVWLKFVAPQTGELTVFTSGTTAKGQLLRADDSTVGTAATLPITRSVEIGQLYYLVISANSGSSHTVNFSLNTISSAPTNSTRTTATSITYTLPRTTSGRNSPALYWDDNELNENSVWYKFTVSSGSARTLVIDTEGSNFDTTLALSDSSGTVLERNDGHGGAQWSKLSYTVQPNTQYWIEVGSSHASDFGDITLRLRELSTPQNNRDINAINIPVENVTLTGSNVNADSQYGEENHIVGYSNYGGGCSSVRPMCAYRPNNSTTSGSSVWWKYTATSSGKIIVNTSGSSFSTVLAAYVVEDATNVSSRSLLQSNYDDCASNGSCIPSSIEMSVRKNLTYLIVVAGFADNGGAASEGSISLTLSARTNLSPPLNDSLSQAQLIDVSTAKTTAGTVIDATGDDGYGAVQGVWYKFTAGTTGVIEFSIADADDLVLGSFIKRGTTLIARHSVISNYVNLRVSVKAGDEYFIEISANRAISISGFTLQSTIITPRNPVLNDIPELATNVAISTSGSVNLPSNNNIVRGAGPLNGYSQGSRFWTFTPNISGTVTFNAAGSLQFGVYQGNDGAFIPVAESNSYYDDADMVPITASVSQGITYTLVVAGHNSITLTWSAVVAPAPPAQSITSAAVANVVAPSILPSSAGTPVTVTKVPPSTFATAAAVGLNGKKVTVALTVPTSKSKTAQIVKYTITLKPSKGKSVTKTVSVKPGKTATPSLTGAKGTTYKVLVTATTKAGKKLKWSGPSVTIAK